MLQGLTHSDIQHMPSGKRHRGKVSRVYPGLHKGAASNKASVYSLRGDVTYPRTITMLFCVFYVPLREERNSYSDGL